MTREEAIEHLKNMAEHSYPNEEYLMAIEALAQQPCDYYDADNKTCRRSEVPKEPCDVVKERTETHACVSLGMIKKIKTIVDEWKADTWTDNISYECMVKIADIVAESEVKG